MLQSLNIRADQLIDAAATNTAIGNASELAAATQIQASTANQQQFVPQQQQQQQQLAAASLLVNNNNNNSNIINSNLNSINNNHLLIAKTEVAKKFHPYLRPNSTAATTNPANLAEMSSTHFVAQQLAAVAAQPTIMPSSGLAAAATQNAISLPANGKDVQYSQLLSTVPSSILCANGNGIAQLAVVKSEPESISQTAAANENVIANNSNANANDELALVPFGSIAADDVEATALLTAKTDPDADHIKMFVGQIPKSWDENQLKVLFEPFGRVHTLNVLRDKVTTMSRGCCFVTYYTRKAALKAQDALHNIKTLEGMHHPIQMKPADSENRNERKLFVGMLNKKYNEADVRQLFTGHGTIEECTVLRDQNGQSKGCAFVTFATKANAIGAIKALHQSQTMEGCSAPIVVKFADTQKEKDQKKIQNLQSSLCGLAPTMALPAPAVASAPATIAGLPVPVSLSTTPLTNSSFNALARSSHSLTGPYGTVAPLAQPNTTALLPTSTALSVTPATLSLSSNAPPQSSAFSLSSGEALSPTSAQQLQIFHQLQNFGSLANPYFQGLNFPPDHSTSSSLGQLAGMNAIGGSGAGGAANASSAAAAVTVSVSNANRSGLLTVPGMTMSNLVNLAAFTGHPYQSAAVAAAAAQSPNTAQTPPSYGHHLSLSSHALAAHGHSATQVPSSNAQNSAAHHPHISQQLASIMSPQPMAAQHSINATQLSGTPAGLWHTADALSTPYSHSVLNSLSSNAYSAALMPPSINMGLQAAQAVAGKQIEGPEGSNLFIYHLPQEFTDIDLATTFFHFGNVLSAKVFIDKQTNLSKCFGFVSYDNPHSANAAIAGMHGYQIGNKRLKVQLKRSKEAAKPY